METNLDAKGWIVLIVDDERDNVGVAEKVIRYNGGVVYTAANGQEGMEALERVIPTLILLDLSMPVMTGWDMLKLIRADARTRHIPVIALTAHAMDGDREKVLEAGFDGYIAKPFHISDLLSQIKSCLDEINRSSM
jgi:two-component system, cell cycle response regulator DivK